MIKRYSHNQPTALNEQKLSYWNNIQVASFWATSVPSENISATRKDDYGILLKIVQTGGDSNDKPQTNAVADVGNRAFSSRAQGDVIN